MDLLPPKARFAYYAGADRIAMRVKNTTDTFYYLLTDHLGSTSVTTDANGAKVAELRYKAFGEARYTNATTPTGRRYTGQLQVDDGLYYYGARFYDASLGRFISADTLIPQPGSPLAWDRYAYANGNPMRYNDPSGHMADGGNGSGGGCITGNCRKANQNPTTNTSKPWHHSQQIDMAYHIGWSVINAPDQSSDDFLNDSSACSYGQTSPLCVLVVLERFGVGVQKDTDANFWVHFNATYDEALGVSITDFSMVNYSDSPLKITNLFFLDGKESVSIYDAMIIPSGFGGDTKIPNPPLFSGEHPITITIEYEQTVNTGSAAHPGPSMLYPEISIGLPSLESLKYSVQTGGLPPLSYP